MPGIKNNGGWVTRDPEKGERPVGVPAARGMG